MSNAMIYSTGAMLAGINAYLNQPTDGSKENNPEASTSVEAIGAHLGGRSSTISSPDSKVGKQLG